MEYWVLTLITFKGLVTCLEQQAEGLDSNMMNYYYWNLHAADANVSLEY